MLLVITGKTASGKDTILDKLLLKYPNFKKVITSTSRAARDGEIEGKDYYFLTRDEFEQKIKINEFIEHVEYGGNLYGTFKTELENSLNSDLIWKIDPSRAGQIRQLLVDIKLIVIYINTDDQIILKRLHDRGLKTNEIEKRMQDDKNIWLQYKDKYDFVIDNVPGQLDKTMDIIYKIIGEQT